ncbi:MAG TPA: hypothetical protein VF755_16735 [Catenuloplanes sp.]|jgi:hypothetical protein
MIRLRRLIALSLALGLVTLAVPGKAFAATTVVLTKSQWLTNNPAPTDVRSCQSRSIYLATGNYFWGAQIARTYATGRNMYLAAGTYTWQTCLYPRNGVYDHYTTLKKPGSPMAHLNVEDTYLRAGTYEWGSWLDPAF